MRRCPDGAKLEVAEGNRTVIALQREEAGIRLGKQRHLREPGLRHARVEIIAADDVFKITTVRLRFS